MYITDFENGRFYQKFGQASEQMTLKLCPFLGDELERFLCTAEYVVKNIKLEITMHCTPSFEIAKS